MSAAPTPRPPLRLALGVALAHAGLLGLLPQAPLPGERGERPAPLALRLLAAPAAAPAQAPNAPNAPKPLATPRAPSPASPATTPPDRAPPPAPRQLARAPTSAPAPRAAPRPRTQTTAAPAAARTAPSEKAALVARHDASGAIQASGASTAPAPQPAALPGAAPSARAAPAAAAPDTAPPPASPAAAPGPTAPVRLPGPATLDYRVQGTARGMAFEAQAQLRWQPGGGRYLAEWTVALPLVGRRSQRSEGALNATGLAPERYAEQARGERAAHFDPAGGRIRFSANTPDALLQAGAQDRLSVCLQLAGLLAAAPERYPPGSHISVQTAGVREAEDWVWDVVGDEPLPVAGRPLAALKLERLPRRPYDTRIELWLAPALGHLPARLRITQANGDVADQWLSALPGAP
jgi:hypothetical protein